MRLLKITAPLTALALLTGACGLLDSDPVPSVSPSGGPALHRVWQVSDKSVDPTPVTVMGNIIVAQAPHNDKEGVFIDGTTGRITGRAFFAGLKDPVEYVSTDDRGRPVVVVEEYDRNHKLSVYDTNGRLLGRAPTDHWLYAGGYFTQDTPKSGLVIRTLSGHQVAHLPLDASHDPWWPPDLTLQAVQPGLLVASGYGANRTRVALIDVSRPGKARVHPLRAPFEPAHPLPAGVQTVVAGGHLYVSWQPAKGDRETLARYDAPATRPAWHVRLPASFGPVAEVQAYPGANDTVTILNDANDRFWFLRPDTGALAAPRAGEPGYIKSVSGGRVYAAKPDPSGVHPKTEVVDPRTGTVRTINAGVEGVTSNGYLISDFYSINAYRWN